MKSLKKDTLVFQLGVRPGTQKRDMSDALLPDVVANLNKFMGDDKLGNCISGSGLPEKPCGNPEVDALVFYMLNHAVSVIRQRVHPLEPLGDLLPIVELFHKHLAFRSARMFFYMLLICTRESRHAKNSVGGQFLNSLGKKYGAPIQGFHASIIGSGSSGAADKLRKHPPDCRLGPYANFLVEVFYHGNFSSSYGGPAWGAVADVLRDFSVGNITAEMMMDTAFTLCHNNGPIFNKGMLFETYSDEIYKILDVQRSGQIPQMVGNCETKHHANPLVRGLWVACSELLGEEFSGYVDWYKVEELGSMKSYPAQKQAQLSKYGPPGGSKAVSTANKLKEEIKKAKEEKEFSSWIEIMPNVKVKMVEVAR